MAYYMETYLSTEIVLRICFTFAIAIASGFIARKCKIPAGMILGPIIAVALTNIFTGQVFFPYSWRFFARIMVGMYMGSLVKVDELKNIFKLRKEAAIILAGLLTANIFIAVFLNNVSEISLITALLANAPGGIQELSLLSADMGGDTAMVTTLQLFRRIISVTMLPVFIEWFSKRDKKKTPAANGEEQLTEEEKPTVESTPRISKKLSIVLMAVSSLVLGSIFHFLNFPSGAMIGAMLAIILLSVNKLSIRLPRTIRIIAQILSGAYIGSTIGMEQVMQLKGILFPMVIMLVYTFTVNVLLSLIIYRFSSIDLRTAMYSCAPGGLSEIGILVIGTGVNVTIVTAMHLLRKIAVVSIFPLVFRWISQLLQ